MFWCLSLFSTFSFFGRRSFFFYLLSISASVSLFSVLSEKLNQNEIPRVAFPNRTLMYGTREHEGDSGSVLVYAAQHRRTHASQGIGILGIPRWCPHVGVPKIPSGQKENKGKLIKEVLCMRAGAGFFLHSDVRARFAASNQLQRLTVGIRLQ